LIRWTPPEVIEKLNVTVKEVLQDPALNEKFESQGIEFMHSTPEQLAELVRTDTKKWERVISEAGIQLE